jgi:uncharacterized protein YndB with AHSA1/START domain
MKTIHHVVDIVAPRATVWSALTDEAQLSSWWSTKVDAPSATVGAETHWTFVGDFNPVMRITALEDGARLEWRCVGGHDPWQEGTFRFELVEIEDGATRLRFWQDYAVELSDDAYGTYNFNWGYYLESLRSLCATGAGKPFRPD